MGAAHPDDTKINEEKEDEAKLLLCGECECKKGEASCAMHPGRITDNMKACADFK